MFIFNELLCLNDIGRSLNLMRNFKQNQDSQLHL